MTAASTLRTRLTAGQIKVYADQYEKVFNVGLTRKKDGTPIAIYSSSKTFYKFMLAITPLPKKSDPTELDKRNTMSRVVHEFITSQTMLCQACIAVRDGFLNNKSLATMHDLYKGLEVCATCKEAAKEVIPTLRLMAGIMLGGRHDPGHAQEVVERGKARTNRHEALEKKIAKLYLDWWRRGFGI